MLKKSIILVILSAVLVTLLIIKSNMEDNDPSNFIMIEYEITEIHKDQYYGKADDGTQIRFSNKDIPIDNEIQVHDVVICYFEKGNLGKGLVKVEKK